MSSLDKLGAADDITVIAPSGPGLGISCERLCVAGPGTVVAATPAALLSRRAPVYCARLLPGMLPLRTSMHPFDGCCCCLYLPLQPPATIPWPHTRLC